MVSLIGLSFFVSLAATTVHNDACHYISPSSVCDDSGMCTGSGVPCREAYITSSIGMLVERNEVPLTPQFDSITYSSLQHMRSRPGNRIIHQDWMYSPIFVDLETNLVRLAGRFQDQFPFIMADIVLIRVLVANAARFEENVVSAIWDSRDPRNLTLYHMALAHTSVVTQLNTYFHAILDYVVSLDFTDPMREAILTHLLPYAHAWLRVHEHLRIPADMQSRGWMEVLDFMSRHDPIYPLNDGEKAWTIPVITPPYVPVMIPIVVPETDPITLEMIDTFPDATNATQTIAAKLARFSRNPGGRADSKAVYELLRIGLYYIRFAQPRVDLARFCRDTHSLWSSYFASFASNPDASSVIFLIHLFRLCGSDYLSLQDRALYVLPALVGRRISPGLPIEYTNGTLPLPIDLLRRGVEFSWHAYGDEENQHAKFLSEYIKTMIRKRPTESRKLHALGSAIALLVIDGDRHATLQTLLSRGTISDFYLGSVSVKRGFCEVINCVSFDVLFNPTELVNLLKLHRQTKPLVRERVLPRYSSRRIGPLPDGFETAAFLASALRMMGVPM